MGGSIGVSHSTSSSYHSHPGFASGSISHSSGGFYQADAFGYGSSPTHEGGREGGQGSPKQQQQQQLDGRDPFDF